MERKFDIGDRVYYINTRGNIESMKVMGYSIALEQGKQIVRYKLTISGECTNHQDILYGTKEEAAEVWMKKQGVKVGICNEN